MARAVCQSVVIESTGWILGLQSPGHAGCFMQRMSPGRHSAHRLGRGAQDSDQAGACVLGEGVGGQQRRTGRVRGRRVRGRHQTAQPRPPQCVLGAAGDPNARLEHVGTAPEGRAAPRPGLRRGIRGDSQIDAEKGPHPVGGAGLYEADRAGDAVPVRRRQSAHAARGKNSPMGNIRRSSQPTSQPWDRPVCTAIRYGEAFCFSALVKITCQSIKMACQRTAVVVLRQAIVTVCHLILTNARFLSLDLDRWELVREHVEAPCRWAAPQGKTLHGELVGCAKILCREDLGLTDSHRASARPFRLDQVVEAE